MSSAIRDFRTAVPGWLAVTRGQDVALGLSREDALRRASVLRDLMRQEKVGAANAVVDDDLKDILHALVALVTHLEPLVGTELADETNAVYQLVADIEWPEDEFDEKRGLLCSLAEVGWRALGASMDELDRGRGERVCHFPPLSGDKGLSHSSLSDWHLLFERARLLCAGRNSSPNKVLEGLTSLYAEVLSSHSPPLFDLEVTLLGDLAISIGTVLRHLCQYDQAEAWFKQAESRYQSLPLPARCLARGELSKHL